MKLKISKQFWAWIILLLLGYVGLCQYYVYDSITSLDAVIKETLHFTAAEYGLLFSFYSVANVFFLALIFAGILVDLWGYRKSGFLFTFLCFLGAVLTAVGGTPNLLKHLLGVSFYSTLHTSFLPSWSPELKVMLLGRMIFGVGAEAILVAIFKILAHWFWNKQLAFAYAFNTTVLRLGTFLALNLQVPIWKGFGLPSALWFSAILMGSGLVVYIIYLVCEKHALKIHTPYHAKGEHDVPFKLKDIFSFKLSFWLITIICISFYSAVLTFDMFGPNILKYKFKLAPEAAGFTTSLMMIATMIFTPIFGWIVDYRGKRATFMMWGSLLGMFCFLWLIFFTFLPYIPIFLIGVALSLVPAALWAAIPLIVSKNKQGTAFGLLGYVQNVGLMLFPWVGGILADDYTFQKNSKIINIDYNPLLLLFTFLAAISFLLAFYLIFVDKRAKKKGFTSIESIQIHND